VRIIIAGGGTGGHLFVGIALAETLRAKEPENRILFVVTKRELEASLLQKRGFGSKGITIEGLKGRSLSHQVRALFKIPFSLAQAIRIIRDFRADLVIGVGGYSSGPVVLAAHFLGIRTAVHEQNFVPGLTNRILAHFVDQVFVSFGESIPFFPEEKTKVTGNPVRRELFTEYRIEKTGNRFTILILGGSQGAHSINMAVIGALDHLKEEVSRLFFIHQTGAKDFEWVMRAYKERNVSAEVNPFIEDMARAYRVSDLVISRAGATTIAELTALGKAAILIPFPFATNNHQERNARFLSEGGAADLILETELDGHLLAKRIIYYVNHPDILQSVEEKARSKGKTDAADLIVDDLLGEEKRSKPRGRTTYSNGLR